MKLSHLTLLAPLACLFINVNAQASDYSLGGTVGSQGLGVSFTKRSELNLVESDQLQWHLLLSGYSFEDAEDVKVHQNDYEADVEAGSLQAGLNWYPSTSSYMKGLFLSAGAIYFDNQIKGTTQDKQTINVGGAIIESDQGVQLTTDIDHTSLAPYFGIGWGNRLSAESGFSFRAELGALAALNKADVSVALINHNNQVSDAQLENERRDIRDEQSRVKLFAQLDLAYQF